MSRKIQPFKFPDMGDVRLAPRWWHKLLFWKEYTYTAYLMNEATAKWAEDIEKMSGVPNHFKGKRPTTPEEYAKLVKLLKKS